VWCHLKYTSVTSLDVDLRKWKTAIYLRIGRRFDDWTSIWVLHIYYKVYMDSLEQARGWTVFTKKGNFDKLSITKKSKFSKQNFSLRIVSASANPSGSFHGYSWNTINLMLNNNQSSNQSSSWSILCWPWSQFGW
jgi:hypothetical protein